MVKRAHDLESEDLGSSPILFLFRWLCTSPLISFRLSSAKWNTNTACHASQLCEDQIQAGMEMQSLPHPDRNPTHSFCRWGLLSFCNWPCVLESQLSGSSTSLALSNTWRCSLLGTSGRQRKGLMRLIPTLNGNYIEFAGFVCTSHSLSSLFWVTWNIPFYSSGPRFLIGGWQIIFAITRCL